MGGGGGELGRFGKEVEFGHAMESCTLARRNLVVRW